MSRHRDPIECNTSIGTSNLRAFFKGTAHRKNENLFFQRNWMQPILVSYEALFRSNLQKKPLVLYIFAVRNPLNCGMLPQDNVNCRGQIILSKGLVSICSCSNCFLIIIILISKVVANKSFFQGKFIFENLTLFL